MAKILGNFHLALLIGVVLLVAAMFGLHREVMHGAYWAVFARYLHIFAGVLWIGLLYYFNFVQIPTMPKVPAELKPGVSKYIAPVALFWFRWAAVATVVIGLILAELISPGYSMNAFKLEDGSRTIGIGMWLGLIMALNVWLVIWPNQKRALGLIEADADTKAKSAKMAMLGSRTNLMLSLPMLVAMTMSQTVFG
jgi:uncharacterized membrane protein